MATRNIPDFDGENIPLSEFIYSVQKGQHGINDEKGYVNELMKLLKDRACDCTVGKNIDTVSDLTILLKRRFTPNETYSFFAEKLEALTPDPNDTVGDLYDKINVLSYRAKDTLNREHPEEIVTNMMRPLKDRTIEIYIRNLPLEIRRPVCYSNPKSLEEAYGRAQITETRIKTGILPQAVSQISRPTTPDCLNKALSNNSNSLNPFNNVVIFKGTKERDGTIRFKNENDFKFIEIPIYEEFQGTTGTLLHNNLQKLKQFLIKGNCSNFQVDPESLIADIDSKTFIKIINKVFKDSPININFVKGLDNFQA